MSDLKPSKIKCKSCGYEPNIIADVCIKCGGQIVKICGNCSHENAVEKNRCDLCGQLLALTPHKKIDIDDKDKFEESNKQNLETKKTIEFESITETISRKEESYRKKINTPQRSDNIDKKLDEVVSEKKRIEEFVKEQKKSSEKPQEVQIKSEKKISFKLLVLLISIFIIFVVFVYLIFGRKSYSRYELILTTKKYLSALRDNEYDKAYEFLSQNSKSIVSFSDYVKTLENYYSKVGKWDFKNIEIYYFDKNQSVIKYKLIENGVEKDDYLNFVREYGKWRRPFVYNLFEEIDDAFNKKDFPKALFLSQRLYLIDPMDPRSSGYLCWSEYLMRLYDKSVESCRRVIELSNIYPIKYYNDIELFWYTFNYADSLRFLGRIEDSIDIYNNLIRNPVASLREKCTVYVARSDSYVAMKKYESVLKDVKSAIEICEDGSIEKNEIIKRFRMLNGDMCNEAIIFAKKYRYNNTTLEEFLADEIKSLAIVNYHIDWGCTHQTGPIYDIKVEVYKGKKIIKTYRAGVDLWEKVLELREGK